jgi:hypothetical protein
MKWFSQLLLFLIFFSSCVKKNNNRNPELEEFQSTTEISEPVKLENGTIHPILADSNWINPSYLTADFNGDSNLDTAFAVIINNKKGIKIKHGKTNEIHLIGAGIDFGNGGDDFNWVDKWKLVTEKTTYEITFMDSGDVDGSRTINLQNTSFYIGTEESGGATIAWINGKYTWIHQAD